MDRNVSIYVLSNVLTAFITIIACYYHYSTQPTHTTNTVKIMPQEGEIYTDYEPKDFKKNYEIYLKQDGNLIKDIDGDVYYVPHFDLEDWFMRINL